MYGSGVLQQRRECLAHHAAFDSAGAVRLLWLSSSHSADSCLTVKAGMEYKESH